jgi:NAD+ diphosphatase
MKKELRFIPGIVPPKGEGGLALWFAFQGNKLLVHLDGDGSRVRIPTDLLGLGLKPRHPNYLGKLDGVPCYAAEIPEPTPPPRAMAFEGLRQLYGRLEEDLFAIAGRAIQILDWDRNHRFCSRCATPLALREKERAKGCPRCGLLQFPRLAPAIIVRVEKGDQLLMARSPHFAPGVYSVLAGFVDPGESLEEAVAREVREETGIEVKDIRYFGSQPWPFPHSLMIGFTATYAGGELHFDREEIEDAGWFTAEKLPPALPGKISIARRLVDDFLARKNKANEKERKKKPAGVLANQPSLPFERG